MLFELDYYDLTVLLDGLGYEDNSDILASYLMDCCCDGWNVKQWVANSTYECFENKEEALEYIEKKKLTLDEDCSIYECEYCNGVFLDIY